MPILKCDIVLQFLEVMKHLERHFATDKRTKGREFFPDLYARYLVIINFHFFLYFIIMNNLKELNEETCDVLQFSV